MVHAGLGIWIREFSLEYPWKENVGVYYVEG